MGRIRLDAEIFDSGKKKMRIQKYPDHLDGALIGNKELNWLRSESFL